MTPRDTLLRHATVLTLDRDRRILRDGAIAIQGGRIAAVDPDHIVVQRFGHLASRDLSGHVILPGLIDAHLHITEHLWRGWIPDDARPDSWLPRYLLPAFSRITPEDERAASTLAMMEALRSGTTCIADAGTIFDVPAVAQAAQDVGIRAVLGCWSTDQRSPAAGHATWPGKTGPRPTEQVLRDIESSIAAVRSLQDPRVTAWPVVLGLGVCSEALIRGAFAIARAHGTGLGMMFAATRPHHVGGETVSLASLEAWGVLDRRTKLVHAVYLAPTDVPVLAASGCAVVCCPSAAMRHQKGLGRYGLHPEMLDAGVPVALGSDSANAGNHCDLMRLMWTTATLFKDAREDVASLPAETVLEMATLHGARALGLESELGSIEVGKQADLVVHSTDDPAWHPMLNIVNNVVYAASSRTIRTVFVAGEPVYEHERYRTLDLADVTASVTARARRIIQELDGSIEQRWPVLD